MTAKPPEKTCPVCHAPMAFLYGAGVTCDRWWCKCGHHEDLDTSTDPEPDNEKTPN